LNKPNEEIDLQKKKIRKIIPVMRGFILKCFPTSYRK